MKPAIRSWTMVSIQVAGILALALSGPLIPGNDILCGMAIFGVALGGWAVLTMRLSQLRIFPEPATHSRLVTAGPYRWIRHPMYSSVMLVTTAWVLGDFTWPRLAIWLILAVNMLVKMSREETLMHQRFPDYAAYAKRTRRILPFLY